MVYYRNITADIINIEILVSAISEIVLKPGT